MRIVINGDDKEVLEGVTIAELITDLDLKPERVAIELNRKILSRSEWPDAGLADGDKLEIVHFVGGGMPTTPAGYTAHCERFKRAPRPAANSNHLPFIVE